jgi:hypothetical protein
MDRAVHTGKMTSCIIDEAVFLSGANSRDRTDDLRITNALLYQLSYVGVWGDKTR